MERKKNFFDFIGKLLPGYKGYVIREEKRNTDKKLRDELSKRIENAKLMIIDFQQDLIKKNEIALCQEWDLLRKSVDTLFSKIKYAAHGESSFFSEKQLKENELDEIYNLDLIVVENVDMVCKSVDSCIQDTLNPKPINKMVRDIEIALDNRNNYINTFK
jgi:hypothetical protein